MFVIHGGNNGLLLQKKNPGPETQVADVKRRANFPGYRFLLLKQLHLSFCIKFITVLSFLSHAYRIQARKCINPSVKINGDQ
jgi:hypothetical protein